MGGSSSDEGGKGKFRIGGGVKSKSKSKNKDKGETSASLSTYLQYKDNKQAIPDDGFLPETMKASTLLEQIACERNWPLSMLESDLEVLQKNRLFTVSDLRVLSKDSWKVIELLPIVKDLLRNKLYPKAAKKNKKLKKNSSCSSDDEPTELLIENSTGPLANNGASKPPPGTITAAGSKIKVVGSNGKIYQADRYCPHKGVDLAKGWLTGNSVICPKHKWAFDLSNNGTCATKSGYSLKACEINDW